MKSGEGGWAEAALEVSAHTGGGGGDKNSPEKPLLSPAPGSGVGGMAWLFLDLTWAGALVASSLSESSSLLSEESSGSSALTLIGATVSPAFPGGAAAVPWPEGPLVGVEAVFTVTPFPTGFAWNDRGQQRVTGAPGAT